MLFDLKTQELMHSFQSLGVRSADEHFAATIRLDILGRKVALHPLHFGNTGRSLSMRHHRRREIPLRKSFGYSLQVLADLIPSGRIGWVIRLNFDDTTGRSELEMVGCLGVRVIRSQTTKKYGQGGQRKSDPYCNLDPKNMPALRGSEWMRSRNRNPYGKATPANRW